MTWSTGRKKYQRARSFGFFSMSATVTSKSRITPRSNSPSSGATFSERRSRIFSISAALFPTSTQDRGRSGNQNWLVKMWSTWRGSLRRWRFDAALSARVTKALFLRAARVIFPRLSFSPFSQIELLVTEKTPRWLGYNYMQRELQRDLNNTLSLLIESRSIHSF